MKMISAASGKSQHPSTTKLSLCMNYLFDTGHKCTVWSDGTKFYHKKNGCALPQNAMKLRTAMDQLIKEDPLGNGI